MLSLGIDTSNYKTSIGVFNAEKEEIVSDRRALLEVEKGRRGLRQQEALFQHLTNIPRLYKEVVLDLEQRGYSPQNISVVSASSRPRDIEGSYMPVFLGGTTFAENLGTTLGVPVHFFSHQQGHIEASKYGVFSGEDFIFLHLSGGTCEILDKNENILGGSLDISFGQLVDRVGVALGMEFPSGIFLDNLALEATLIDKFSMPPLKFKDLSFNLSGAETYLLDYVEKGMDKNLVAKLLFNYISKALEEIIIKTNRSTKETNFLLGGGVASSRYIREYFQKNKIENINIYFAKEELSSDNGLGIAMLGGKYGSKANYSIST